MGLEMSNFNDPGADRVGSSLVSFRGSRRSSRMALVIGFGGLISIMALAGFDALRSLQQFQHSDDQIRRHYLAQNHLLNDIRSDVYVSGTYVRDYLLEADLERAEAYRISLEDVHRHMESALESYGREVAPLEARHYTVLRAKLTDYWEILTPIFKWDTAERRRSGYAFLRDDVFPRRQSMLAIADQIANIDEQHLNSGNDQVVGLLLKFRARLVITLVAALALGLGLAALCMYKILKLEAQVHTRYEEAAEARSALKGLSARLVQAQETERRALSRELHDEVGQSLSAVLIELRNLSVGLATKSKEHLTERVETIKSLVEGMIRVVRNMALLLRPSMLDDLGLVPALKWQAREVSRRTSTDVSVAAELVSDDFPDEYKTCIYRVVQEALHNVSNHAHASSVRIRVQQEQDRLTLSIQDDGKGFDSEQVKGLGLLGIQERVTRLGGKCTVHSTLGSGTILAVELPFSTRLLSSATSSESEDMREADSHPVG
jgi:signal transduction histidine kinase